MSNRQKTTVTVSGKAYPCYVTMGALLQLKQETGLELTDVGTSLSGLVTFMWCCVKSAARREGVPFDMPLQYFADSIDLDDFTAWSESLNADGAQGGADGEKKR